MDAERSLSRRDRASWRWLAALLLVACVDGPTSPGLYGELRIRPAYASGDAPSAIGLTVDSAKVRIERASGGAVLVDSMVTYRSDTVSFGWILDLLSAEDQVRVQVEIWDESASLYSGDSVVTVLDGVLGGEAAEILVAYVGPPIVATIAVSPETATLDALGATSAYTAVAKDRHGAVVTTAFAWSTGDPAIATVDPATGVVTSTGNGTTSVSASAGGVSAGASVVVAQRVASVSLSPEASTITKIGNSVTLVASARDANGHLVASAALEWSSSDAGVATVDAAGVVTAKAGGSVTITATSGGVSGSASVTVSPVESVASIVVTPSSHTLTALGATQQYVAEARDANGVALAGIAFTWTSSAPDVASIDPVSGVATAVGHGSTTISASVNGVTGTATLTVNLLPTIASITVSPPAASLGAIGAVQQFTAVAHDASNNVLPGVSFTWSTRNDQVATVDPASGLATATGHGTATIRASAGSVSGDASLNVNLVPVVASVSVSPPNASLSALGATQEFTAVARDASNNVLPGLTFSWSSSATDVATVSPTTGLATAAGHGTTTITATVNGISGTAALDVDLAPVIASIVVSPASITLDALGATQQFSAVARDASNNVLPGMSFTWSSTNAQVATVDRASGLATATGHGTTSIRASIGDVSSDANLTVNLESALASIDVSPASATLGEVGAQQQFTAVGRDAGNNVLPGVQFTWTSSATQVATVDPATGLATAAAHGSTTITASVNGVTGSATLEVNLAPAIASIVVSPASATLSEIGARQQFTAVARDASNNVVPGVTFTWTSADEAVATVDATGRATAAGHGTTAIRATAGNVFGEATVIVNLAPFVASVTVSPGSATLTAPGSTQQFTAVARDAGNNVLPGVQFTWASSATAVATTDPATGLATAAGQGTTTITATVNGVSGTATLDVSLVSIVASIEVSPASATLGALNATRQFTAVARDAANNLLPGVTFAWTTSNDPVATVSTSGLATATGHGSTQVSASVNGVTGSATLEVSLVGAISTITVTPFSVVLHAVGATQQYVAEARDAQGRVLPGVTFTWTSSDESAGIVNATTGLATAVCHGETKITASAGGRSGNGWLIVDLAAALTAIRPGNAAVIVPPPC